MDVQKTVGARVCHDRDQAVSQGTETPLILNTVRYDTDNLYDSKQNTRLTCKTAGIYIMVAMCIWNATVHGMYQITIKLNGDRVIGTGRDQGMQWWNPFTTCTATWEMEVGDYVEAVVFFWTQQEPWRQVSVMRASHWDSPEFMMHLLR